MNLTKGQENPYYRLFLIIIVIIIILMAVMIDFICELDWAMRYPDIWSNIVIFLGGCFWRY